MSPIQTILKRCDGSTTELARRLTVATEVYYTPNQVQNWVRTDQVPGLHMTAVATTFDMQPEDVCPELFQKYNRRGSDKNVRD